MSIPQSKARLFEAPVAVNERVARGIYRLVLRAPELARALEYGQFVNVKAPGETMQVLRVPLSFSRANRRNGAVEIVYAVVGTGTRAIQSARPGSVLSVVGPCGNPWRVREGQGRSVVVSGGVGITPILGAACMLHEHDVPFDAVAGAQTAKRLWGTRDLKRAGAGQVLVTTDDGSLARKGFATDALADLLDEGGVEQVYACGPEPMLAGVARLCAARDVACQVSMERMMCCGFAACGTCNVPLAAGGYASVCGNGPIFDAKEVAWQ